LSCFIDILQHEWQPVQSLVNTLRSRYNDYAVFFYNEFAPDIIAMIWRPDAFRPQQFSAIVSDFKRPAAEVWQNDDLVITNTEDLMAEIGHFARNIVSTFKVRYAVVAVIALTFPFLLYYELNRQFDAFHPLV
jgi:hypothetical protein